jgi:hypothetical protein
VKSFRLHAFKIFGMWRSRTPKVPKARVNHGHPKSEDTCQQIMYSGGLALQKKLGVEEPPKSQRPRVHLGHPLERTHIDRLEDPEDRYSRRIVGREG